MPQRTLYEGEGKGMDYKMNKKIFLGILLIAASFAIVSFNSIFNLTGYAITEELPNLIPLKDLVISLILFFLGGFLVLTSGLEYRVPERIPSGTFYAKRFRSQLHPELGYHLHPEYLAGASYKDTKYFITIENGNYIAVPHREGARATKPPVDLSSKSAKKALKSDLYEELKKLKKRSIHRAPSTREGLITLFSVDEID